MKSGDCIEVQNIDHLGLVAGMIDEIGLVEQINQLLGQHPQEQISAGHAVKAMILNGLGFVSGALYIFSKFFEGLACEHLIGSGIKPEYLNDDRLGRVLDQLYMKGLSQVFMSPHLSKRIYKLETTAQKKLQKLRGEEFACHQDAMKAATQLSKQFKYHQLTQVIISNNPPKKLKKNREWSQLAQKCYRFNATLEKVESVIEVDQRSAVRFVLATNVLDQAILSHDEMIAEYKAQQSCERGFGFLKDPLFFTDSVLLKSPERIEALAMVMGLCLLVYTLAQRQLHTALSAAKSGIKNQLGLLRNRPTLRWIFQCFQAVHLVIINGLNQICNLTDERLWILQFFPAACRRYYLFE